MIFRYSVGVNICQISPRGQVTLPADIRRAVGLHGGDALQVTIENGRIILQPVMTLPIRLYTDADLAMFEDAAAMTDQELASAAELWGVRGDVS
ncbi:MAG: hypothetical protein QG597_3612 [Actinomycetota bacterium]|nr:hypothetical protein [Actinomycetota bacterium]